MAITRPIADVTTLEVAAIAQPVDVAPKPPAPAKGTDRPDVSLGYTPGFDGLRAFGLVVILAYHHGVSTARGGIFTVSMFFTLSGFLIATLTLAEWSKQGRMSMLRFWERRARRLLPAAMATIVGVVALQYFAHVGSGEPFRKDLIAALGYGANWRFSYSGADYGKIFSLEAPVQHFWSLAVEEQFYLAFPLLFVGLMALARGRWRVVGAAFGVIAAASFVAAWLVARNEGTNSGLAYYATYTRASEILVGVALAFAVATRPAQRFLASPRGTRLVRWGGVLGLAGFCWLWTTVSLKNPLVFRGATVLNAALTSLVILACISSAPGRAARVLGIWPLRSLGKISYGVYLFHWPLFLWLTKDRAWGLGFWPLFALRVGVTIGLAVASYHLIESPFRFRIRVSLPKLAAMLMAAGVATVALVRLVPVHEPPRTQLANMGTLPLDPLSVGMANPAPGVAPAAHVLVIGDSIAWTTWPGYMTWNFNHPDQAVSLDTVMSMGCSLGDPAVTSLLAEVGEATEPCKILRQRVADAMAVADYDAIVVTLGHKDLGERELDGKWRHLGDRVFDDFFRGEVGEWADLLATEGAPVLWSTATHVRMYYKGDPSSHWQDYQENDELRVDRLNEIVTDALADRPGIQMLDVSGWLADRPGGEFNEKDRVDGVHYSESGSDALAEFVVPQILEAKARSDAAAVGG